MGTLKRILRGDMDDLSSSVRPSQGAAVLVSLPRNVYYMDEEDRRQSADDSTVANYQYGDTNFDLKSRMFGTTPTFFNSGMTGPISNGSYGYQESHFLNRKRQEASMNKTEKGPGLANGSSKFSLKTASPGPDGFHPNDDKSSFFAKGRDFESVNTNHKYTISERELLATHDSQDYLPPHSEVYKKWIRKRPARLNWDRWYMMALIGCAVGIVGYLLHQTVALISDFKWERAEEYIKEDIWKAYAWLLSYSLGFTAIASFLVAFVWPYAAGSGIPEIIGFLNGTVVRHALNLKTFIVKFMSCACAVGGGLPVGPEGPMIHIGAIVGNGLSQFRSRTFGCKLPFFERFRNSEDRRNFTSAGAGAGVASAFGAPVGGLLFALEEVSSFWTMKLSWMTFFCCMVATFSTDFLNSAFAEFKYWGSVGLFDVDKYIIFRVRDALAINIIMFLPSVVLGIFGGILGAIFTIINLKIGRTRRAIMSKITNKWLEKLARFFEPLIIMAILGTCAVWIPTLFPCKPSTCPTLPANVTALPNGTDIKCPVVGNFTWKISKHAVQFTCSGPEHGEAHSASAHGQYNELASLLFLGGEEAVHNMFSRRTHLMFDYLSLVTAFVIYFLLAGWIPGSSVSAGLVVPMLYIGGLYGRILGRGMVDIFYMVTGQMPTDPYWEWIDPGAFALIGAASFFGGVSRLTMSLTVIMMEITNDIQFLLPIMVSVMTAKWVGDMITHPLYHSLLELKCIPFLADEPVVFDDKHDVVNLELYSVADIMTTPVTTLQIHESVRTLARLVLQNPYGGYPVVSSDGDNDDHLFGLITRNEIIILLTEAEIPPHAPPDKVYTPSLSFGVLRDAIDRLGSLKMREALLQKYVTNSSYQDIMLDLSPFINKSSSSIQSSFSLHRTYIMFRTLGLRHLTVVDRRNRVVGILSRKDIMGHYLEEKLDLKQRRQRHRTQRKVESERRKGKEAFAYENIVVSTTLEREGNDHMRNDDVLY